MLCMRIEVKGEIDFISKFILIAKGRTLLKHVGMMLLV